MGLFSTKQVFVSSVVYNMAGPEVDRLNYLKASIAGNVIGNSKFSMSEALTGSYLSGPGIKARQFFRWAFDNYNDIGVPNCLILNRPDWDIPAIRQEMPEWAGIRTVHIMEIRAGLWDAQYWAEQFLMGYNAGVLATDTWTMVTDPVANTITIDHGDGITPDSVIPVPPDTGKTYLYISYLAVDSTTEMWVPKLYIYEIGSGNAVLDAAPIMDVPEGAFFPVIPIRIDNEFLSDTYKPEIYELASKAYKKATGQSFDKVVETIADNPDLGDIDHCYMVHGVSLNCLENSSRRYLFKFFEYLMPYTQKDLNDYTDWFDNQLTTYTITKLDYGGELDSYEGDADASYDYIIATDAPYYPSNKPLTSIQLQTTGTGPYAIKYDVDMRWSAITKITGVGLKEPGRVKGECWLTVGSTYDTGSGAVVIGNSVIDYTQDDDDVIEIHWQKEDNAWETLQIVGLKHINKVYKDNAVEITAKEALEDLEESGFIVPLHYETFRTMSLVDSTQMFTASRYLVFNCYEVVKTKWYQSALFKIILVVAVIAITVATGGAGAAGFGVLGSAASVGAALGFTGLAAAVVGAVANAIAAMIIMQLVTRVSTAIFGEKFGLIIATVASLIAIQVGSTLMSGGNMATMWGNMMSAQNIIGMTTAVGNGVAGYVQASAAQWGEKTQELLEDYQKQSREIQIKFFEEFGYGSGLDPISLFTDAGLISSESVQHFLDRTLMTGPDIAEMSLDMLTNFSEYTLDLNTIGR
jgi:hypothetical protein